ncbi:uncharacterized protein LOC115401727 isoform X2 [Salarias fasciatus]|uniref:uncharacterized protein LOC115401727 isoform X2 n=1 Tax=Salarias fasciatus TaxID=181472 RepID=UPI001176E9B3|nr:uncharacterized protein LOC115401727 isoform X2 [Salarias fasciatus]
MEDGYQQIGSESEEEVPASWRKFSIILTGRTNGAHQSVVRTFKSEGQTEARSPGDADYCLVFCPVSSRVGTDVSEAMDHLPAGKDAVLVVMHHTFNPEQVIPPSRRVVTDQRVQLTLDCLFHQDDLLSCKLNRNMENDIRKFFRASRSQGRVSAPPSGLFQARRTRILFIVAGMILLLLIIILLAILIFHQSDPHPGGDRTNQTVHQAGAVRTSSA